MSISETPSQATKAREYLAFISYRHADNKQQGRQWASWLHQALETYEVPADLVGKTNGRGEVIPERIYPIFRDEEELPADADLGNSITKALEHSRLLVVLCSPNAVASSYVADEIRYFKSLGRDANIIAAIIAGEPNVSWAEGKAEDADKECFPKPLQFEVDSTGELTDTRAEPIAADFRVNVNGELEEGWTSPAAYREYLKSRDELKADEVTSLVKEYEQQQQLMLLKIIAGILGVPLGELTQRDKAYQLELAKKRAKTLRRWLAGITVVSILAIVAGIFAWQQRQVALQNEQLALSNEKIAKENEQKAIEERNQTLIGQSRYLFEQARQANEDGQGDLALLLGLNAVPGIHGGDRPMPESLAHLRTAVYNNSQQIVVREIEDIRKTGFSGDGSHFFVITDSPTMKLYRSDTGELVQTFELPIKVNGARFNADDSLLAISDGFRVSLWERESGQYRQIWEQYTQRSMPKLTFSVDGKLLYVSGFVNQLYALSVEDGSQVYLVDDSDISYDHLTLSSDGQWLLGKGRLSTEFDVRDASSGELVHTVPGDFNYVRASLNPLFHLNSTEVLYYRVDGTHVLNLETGETKLLAEQVHALPSHDFKKGLMMAANNMPQGEADLIYSLQSLQKSPMLISLDRSGPEQAPIELTHFSEFADALFSPDNRYVLTVYFGALHFWDQQTGKKSHEIKMIGSGGSHVEFSPDGSRVLVEFGDPNAVGVWLTGKRWQELAFSKPTQSYSLRLTADGKTAYLPPIEEGQKTRLVSTTEPLKEVELQADCNDPRRVAFSRDGQRVYAECGYGNPGKIFDAATGEVAWQSDYHRFMAFYNFTMSPSFRWLVIPLDRGHDELFKLYDTESDLSIEHSFGQELKHGPRGNILFTPDERYMAFKYRKNRLYVVDMVSKQTVLKLDEEQEIRHFVLGADNQSVYVHFADNRTQKYDIKTGSAGVQIASTGDMSQLLSLRQGELLAQIATNGEVGFWSGKTGEFVTRFVTRANKPKFAVSPDGRFLLSVSGWPLTVLSLDPLGVFYLGEGTDYSKVAVDSDTDELVLMSATGIKRLPAYTDSIIEKAGAALSPSRRCLSSHERERYYLPPLSDEDRLARGCVPMHDGESE